MMYHFMFGLRGASAVAVDPSAVGGCCSLSPLAPASCFSSSGIGCFFVNPASAILESVALEIVEQETDPRLNELVDDEKVHCENENSNDHDRGRGAHFLPGRRGHLAHLGAHVVVEDLYPLRPGPDPIAEISAGRCD